MKAFFRETFCAAAVIFLSALPLVTNAQTPVEGTPVPNPTSGLSYTLNNPIGVTSVQDLLVIILNIVIILAVPIVVLFIILAGFKYVTARGNPGKIQEATQALTFAVIGGVLIIGAVSIAEIIKNLVSAF